MTMITTPKHQASFQIPSKFIMVSPCSCPPLARQINIPNCTLIHICPKSFSSTKRTMLERPLSAFNRPSTSSISLHQRHLQPAIQDILAAVGRDVIVHRKISGRNRSIVFSYAPISQSALPSRSPSIGRV